MNFMARETGLPVIKEADFPNAPVTFISATDYSLEEALDVLNRMLWMHGLQVRRDANYLLVTKLEDSKPGAPVVGDKVPAGVGQTQMVTIVVPLQNALAAQLGEQLKPLLSKYGAITPLPTQNSLVIVDTAAQCSRLREVIGQLDAKRPSDSQYRLFPLYAAKADVVFNALKGLIAEKVTTILIEKDGTKRTIQEQNIAGMSIQPFAPTNAIIAVGPESRLKTVEELVALLDKPGDGDDRSMMTFALAAANPDDAAGRINGLFASTPPEKKPTVLPMKEQGKLTIIGSAAQLSLAASLIGELDPGAAATRGVGSTGPAKPESRAEVIRLKFVTPASVQNILTRLLSPRQTAVLRFAPSPDDKGLIVSGPAGDVESIQQVIAGIDVAPQLDAEVRQVVIATGDAEKVLARAGELYALSARAKTDPVTAALDKESRTATLVGSKGGLAAFTDLLKSAEATATISRETRSYELAKVRPGVLAPKLSRLAKPMLAPSDGSAYIEPVVEPIDEMNRLIVRARPEQFAVLDQLVKTLDAPEAGKLGFRVIKVSGADAKGLSERALNLYAQQTQGVPEDQAGKVNVEIDSASGSLLVIANPAGMDRFVQIIGELQRQSGPARELRMIDLKFARAAEVVTFLADMLRGSKPFINMGGADPVFEPIEATNSVLVASQPQQFAVIDQLVKSLDSRRAADRPPLRILKLRTTEAVNIAQVLNQSYAARSPEEKAKHPVDISADAATNTLIVSAHADMLPEIDRIVAELNETQAVDATGREIKIFPLKIARAEELAQTIDQMYPVPPMPRDRNGAPRPDLQRPKEVSVRGNAATNSLIVDAPSARMAGFEQLVKQLDQQKLAENIEIRTYRVQRAELAAVTTTLKSAAQSGGLTGGRPPTAGGSASITIDAEPISRTLIVSGPAEIFPQVEKVLAQIDAAPNRPATSVRMYALEHARAERLQPMLSKLLLARLKVQEATDGKSVIDTQTLLDVAADNATNTLIISAPEAIQQIGAELIKALDTPAAQVGRPVIRVIPLTYADAPQAASTINSLLPTIDLPSGGKATVVATAGSNALLLSGAEADLKKIEEMVTKLDVRPVSPDTVNVETFALKHADATAIATMVQGLLQEKQQTDPAILRMQMQFSRGQLPKVPQVKVEADPRTNSLVVSGPSAIVELAKTVIERLDQPAGETGRTARAYTPAKAAAADLVKAAQPVLNATLPPGRKPIELIVQPGGGTVLAIGTPEQVAAAIPILADFDDRTIAMPAVELQVFDMANSDASSVAKAVQAMLAERSRWPEALRAAERAGLGIPTPTVNADAKDNRLIVSAPTELMPVARQLIAALDIKNQGGTIEVRVFTLRKSKADSVAAALKAGLTAQTRPGEPAPVITAEPGSNSVVVAAPSARLNQAAELVKSMDESSQPDGVAVRTIYLKHAQAEAITPVIESLLSKKSVLEMLPQWERGNFLRQQTQQEAAGIRVAAERRLNAVVVTGPVGVIEVAEQIVKELDADPQADPTRARSVRLITLANADAAATAASVEALFKDDATGQSAPTVRVDKDSNSLIIRATAAQMESIGQFVQSLDKATLSASRELRLIPVDRSRADAGMMAQALQRLLEQRGGTKVEIISAEDLLAKPADKPGTKDAKPEPKKDDRRSDASSPHIVASPFRAMLTPGGSPVPRSPAGLRGAIELAQVALALTTLDETEGPHDDKPTPPPPPSASQPAKPAPVATGPAQPVLLPPLEGDSNRPVTIAVDPVTNSLIIVGPTRLADRIAALAAELEKQMPAEPRKLRVVTLPEHVDTQSVSTLISAAAQQIGKSGPTNPGGFTGPVSVQPDPAGGALIVSANDTDFAVLRDIIAAVSRPGPSSSITIKMYPLSTLTAQSAAKAVTDLLSDKPTGRQNQRIRAQEVTVSNPDGTTRATINADLIRITPDPSGMALIVAAPAEAMPLLDRFIAMIDQSPAVDRLAVRRYEIKNAKAADAAKTLQGVFEALRSQRQGGGGGGQDVPQAKFIPDDRTNALLVTASDAQLKEIDRLLVSIDAPLEDARTQVAMIPLQLAKPTAVKQIVEAIIVGRDEGKKDRIRISASDDSSLLIVRGTEEQIAETRRIIAEVDKAETTGLPIRSIKLERADAQAVASGLQKFFEDRARVSTRTGAGQRSQARQVAIVGDRRSSTLVISAADEDYEQIKSMIATFDSPAKARDLQFRVIPLENARVSEVRQSIENMVNDVTYDPSSFFWWSGRGGGGDQAPKDKLVVEFNERANSVIVMGQGESFDTVERIVKALDTPNPPGTALALKAVKLKHADAKVVGPAVQQALTNPSWPRWRGVDPDGVRVEADARTGTLVLIGRADRLKEAAAYIEQLDTDSKGPDRLLESVPLKFAKAERIAQSVEKFFKDRAGSRGAAESNVSVLGSPDGNVVIVQAAADDMKIVKDLLVQMDQPDEGEGRVRELFRLKNAGAKELSDTLRDQFPKSLSSREGLVIVTPLPTSDSVIVSAPRELFEKVSALIAQLDAPPTNESTKMVTVTLSKAHADEVAASLQKALPTGIKVTITPVKRTNSVLLTGSDEAVKLVMDQITALDEQVVKNPVEFRRMKLQNAEAWDVASTIRTLLRNRQSSPGDPVAAVSSSSADNTILVSATAEQLDEIQKIITEVDVPSATSRTTEFVPLKFADAEATSSALGVFYGRYAPEATTPGARSATIIANPVSRSLVISADEAEWPKIRSLIEKLDNETYDTSRRLEIVALRHADAVGLARTLTEAFAAPLRAQLERERARRPRNTNASPNNQRDDQGPDIPTVLVDSKDTVSVSAEPLTNSLVVSGAKEQIDRIRALVAQLDVPEFSRLPAAQIIPLRIGPASVIANTLRQMFTDQGVGTGASVNARSGPRSVMIVGEDKANALIVRADESQFAQIKAMADSIQQEGDKSRVQVRVLRMVNIPAARIAASLKTTFAPVAQQAGEPMTIEIDRANNALVVASSEKVFGQIKLVAQELDGSAAAQTPSKDGVTPALNRSVFIIDVEHNSPEEVKKLLEQMGITKPQTGDSPGIVGEPVMIVPLTSRRALAIVADPRDGESVVALVRSLDAAPLFADQRVSMIRLKTGNATEVVAALDSMLKPDPKDGRTPAAAALVEQVRRLSVRRTGVDQKDLDLDLTRPIRITADKQTNSVLIVSTPANVEALSGVVEMLDHLPIGDAVTVRFFPLANASAQRIASVVKELFNQGDILRQIPATTIKGEPTTEVGKALSGKIAVSVDDRTNALVVAGREEAVALVEILVKQLDGDRAANWVEPRIIHLKNADATKLSAVLKQALVQSGTGVAESPEAEALRKQVARLRIVQAGKDPSDPAARAEADLVAPLSAIVMIPDSQSNSIITVASPANLNVVQSLVAMLDVPTASAANTVRLFPLQFAAADRVGTMLQGLFKQQVASGVIRAEDDIFVTPDIRTNSLVVTTSARSFQLVESILSKLDGEGARPLVGLHVIPIPQGNVTLLAPKIERLMRDRIDSANRAGGIASPRDAFSIQAEPATNSLIVAASDENLKIIEQLIEVLSRSAGELDKAAVLDVVVVKNSRAEQLLPALKELYVNKENTARGQDSVRVTADPRLNALIVSGTAADLDAIKGIVNRLDSLEVSAVTEYKRIELKKADATEVVRLLKSVLAGRPLSGSRVADSRQTVLRFVRQKQADSIQQEQGHEATEAEVSGALLEQVQIDAEARSNSVVVVAPARLMVLIEAMIQDLDATHAGARTIEVFKLKNADARQMADVLRNLFNLKQQGDTLVLVPQRDNPNQPPDNPSGAAGTGGAPAATGNNTILGGNLFPISDARQALAITIDARTNRLLVSATVEYLEQVRKVVEELDGVEANEREQITYELRNAKALEVAKTINGYFKGEIDTLRSTLGAERSGSLLGLLEREVTVQGDEKSNRLIVGVSPRYKESFDTLIKELDSTPPQVMIQVLLAEVTLDSSSTWGVDVHVGPFGGENYRIGALAAGAGVATALGVPNLSISSTDFELLIRALEAQGRLEVLSRPQILIKNNEEGHLQVGEKLQIADRTERLSNGNLSTTTRNQDVGIILNVTPSISADGFVSMEIAPEISAVTARTTQVSENLSTPIISVRQVKTSVMVKDGETIIIGGLIQTNDEERKTRIPLLSDIPLIGNVFRSSNFNHVKTELLVILTPKVIRSGHEEAIKTIRELTRQEIQRLSKPEVLAPLLDGVPGEPAASPAVPTVQPRPTEPAGPRPSNTEPSEPIPGPFDPGRPPLESAGPQSTKRTP